MPRASTPRLAPGFTLPTRRTFILPGSEPITDAHHLLDQTNEYVVRALNSSYPASIQPTNRTHHLHGYNTRSWFLSTGTWSSHDFKTLIHKLRNRKKVAISEKFRCPQHILQYPRTGFQLKNHIPRCHSVDIFITSQNRNWRMKDFETV
ncbi:hypothetical protein DFH27DRAFT_607614 [Peziza echinospora]|nr:hypothetical protein DFH27DRAFT_607614 [Peziza echinospora]